MNRLPDLIGRHLTLIGILLLAIFAGAAAGLYWDVPGRIQSTVRARESKRTAGQYSCPMHPEVVSAQRGQCPKCGMALTPASESQSAHAGCDEAGKTEQHSCCAKPKAAALNLPPGHPPIPEHDDHSGHETNAKPATPVNSQN